MQNSNYNLKEESNNEETEAENIVMNPMLSSNHPPCTSCGHRQFRPAGACMVCQVCGQADGGCG